MSTRSTFEQLLSMQLRQARDEQPQQDRAQLARAKQLVLRNVRRRRMSTGTGFVLATATVMLIGLAVPSALPYSDTPPAGPVPVASVDEQVDPADPWVIASAKRGNIEGDGWIPRMDSAIDS